MIRVSLRPVLYLFVLTGMSASPLAAGPATVEAASESVALERADDARVAARLMDELGYRDQIARGFSRLNTAAAQRKLDEIRNRRERRARAARLEALALRIEAAFGWDRLQPLVQQAWLEHLDSGQLAELASFLETDAGRLYATKAASAINEAAIDQLIHWDALVENLARHSPGAAAPRAARARTPRDDSHEGQALRWLRLYDPDYPQVFEERKAQLLATARTTLPGSDTGAPLDAAATSIIDAHVEQIRLADMEQVATRRLVKELSRAELAVLIAAFETSSMRSLSIARARADRAAHEKVMALIEGELAGGLLWELIRTLGD